MSAAPSCAAECRALVVKTYADRGIEAHASWQPPIIDHGYAPLDLTCPHGLRWYAWPSDAQVSRWAVDGVA